MLLSLGVKKFGSRVLRVILVVRIGAANSALRPHQLNLRTHVSGQPRTWLTLIPPPTHPPTRCARADRFVREGGLDLVLQLLPHPELQYFAMSALVVLLGSPASAMYEDGPTGGDTGCSQTLKP